MPVEAVRILFVNDEPDFALFEIRTWRRKGWRVDIAETVLDALRALDEGEFDILVLDNLLPWTDARGILLDDPPLLRLRGGEFIAWRFFRHQWPPGCQASTNAMSLPGLGGHPDAVRGVVVYSMYLEDTLRISYLHAVSPRPLLYVHPGFSEEIVSFIETHTTLTSLGV